MEFGPQIIAKIVATAILLVIVGVSIFLIWTRDIDIRGTLSAPVERFIRFAHSHGLEIDYRNATAARLVLPDNSNNGKFGFILYSLKIVNSFNSNITIKSVELRYSHKSKTETVDSYVLLTTEIYSASEKKNVDCIVLRVPPKKANIVLMGWNNLRTEIGKNKTLLPGGILSGSALYILNVVSADELSEIKNVELVITDYSGNRTTKQIAVPPEWIEQARMQIVENRTYKKDANGDLQ